MATKRRNQGAESSNNMVAGNASMAGSKDSLGRDLISSNKRPSSSFENDIPRDPKGRRTGSVTSDDENASDDENDADSIEDQIVESSYCPSKSPSNSSIPSTPSMSSPPSMVSSLSMSSRSSTNSTEIIHVSSAILMKDLEIGKVNILVIVIYLIDQLFFIRT
jgi:hypothetical protein